MVRRGAARHGTAPPSPFSRWNFPCALHCTAVPRDAPCSAGIFSFKMMHFGAFWSTFYTNCNCHYYNVHAINSKILIFTCLIQQYSKKGDPEILVQTFLGGGFYFQPRNPL